MSYLSQNTTLPGIDASLGDVLSWAEGNEEKYDAICELRKVPARMSMIDEDIGLIPADLVHFEHVVAATPYGSVSKSKDPDKARKRGNARVRALLKRFHTARGGTVEPRGRADWTDLITYIQDKEGFVERGAKYTTGKSKPLTTLRARCSVAPQDLTQEELDKIHAETQNFRTGGAELLRVVLIRGKVERGNVATILNVAPRTARAVIKELTDAGILGSDTPRSALELRFPSQTHEMLFPNLFEG